MRLWDIRAKPFKPAQAIKVGTNFATTCDLISTSQDILLATGHRGFNNQGAEVMLWTLPLATPKLPESPSFTYKEHVFTPESVRFVSSELLVSASKDQTMHMIDAKTGKKLD